MDGHSILRLIHSSAYEYAENRLNSPFFPPESWSRSVRASFPSNQRHRMPGFRRLALFGLPDSGRLPLLWATGCSCRHHGLSADCAAGSGCRRSRAVQTALTLSVPRSLNWCRPPHCLIQPNTFSMPRRELIDLAYPSWRVVRPSMAEPPGRPVF